MVGNVFTTPSERGQGLAQAATAAVVEELRAVRGCRDVGLNVVAGNSPAVAVYRRLGFETHCPFWEGRATLAPASSR